MSDSVEAGAYPAIPEGQVGRRDIDGVPVYDFCPHCGTEEQVFVMEEHEGSWDDSTPVACDACGHEWAELREWKAELERAMAAAETERGLR